MSRTSRPGSRHAARDPRPGRWLAAAATLAIGIGAGPAGADAANLVGWGNLDGIGVPNDFGGITAPVALPDTPDGVEAAAVGPGRVHVLAAAGVLSAGRASAGNVAQISGLGRGTLTGSELDAATELHLLPDTADVAAVSAGGDATLLLRRDGTIWGFGRNQYGGAGGTATNQVLYSPTKVSGLDGVRIAAVSVGRQHSLALDEQGRIWSWGRGTGGRLGDGTTANRSTPGLVSLPAGRTATRIVAGATHSLALLDDGTVVAWGENANGQLGDGTVVNAATPVAVHGLGGLAVRSLAAGGSTSFALLADGSFRAWGANGWGALGLGRGTTADVLVAAPPAAGAPAAAYPPFAEIVATASSAFAITTVDRRVYAWGNNGSGELGGASVAFAYPFPFGSAAPVTPQTDTEVPQRVGKVHGVPFLAPGSYANQQVVLSDPTLAEQPSSRSSFLGQQLGTIGPAQSIIVRSVGAPSTISRAYVSGAQRHDFLIARSEVGSGDGDWSAQSATSWPLTLAADDAVSIPIRFAPGGEGLRTATLVLEADGETLRVPLEGVGLPLTGGPQGEHGARGEKGEKGDTVTVTVPGGGTVTVAATRSSTSVRRGRTARVPFVLLNGTATTLPKTTATAVVPKALRSTGRSTTKLSPLRPGAARRFSVPVRVGRSAIPGTRTLKIRVTVADRTLTRTVRLRVTR